MLGLFIALRLFARASRVALRDAEFRTLALTVLALLVIGTLFYRNVEGWRWLDCLYFCVVTLATVGYGDFSPQTDEGKVFTMFYIILGVGLVVAVVTKLAQAIVIARREESERVEGRVWRR
jgi:voltage-gated potassium channel